MLLGRTFDCAQFKAIELITVENDFALTLSRQRSQKVQAVGDFFDARVKHDLAGDRVQAVAQGPGALVEHRRVAADDQLRPLRRSFLRLLISVDVDDRGFDLAIALEHITDQLAFKHGAGSADNQLAGVTAHGITGLVAALRSNQRVVVIVCAAPALAGVFKTFVKAGIQNVARRLRQFVQAAVRAFEPALLNVTALHIYGAARQVELRVFLRDHFIAGKGQRAALSHPLAHGMPLGTEVAAHFQQATGGVPAIRRVTVGACRDKHQFAQINPHIVVDQFAAVTVDRRVALLVTLHVDLDIVGFHRHLDAHGA